MEKIVSGVFTGLLVLPALLRAADTNEVSAAGISGTNQITTLPEITITATRVSASTDDTSSSATIISSDEIARSQQRFVADVLRGVPGLSVAQTGAPGSETSVFMRGAGSDQTLVLIDGIRVNNPFNNGFDFSTLPVNDIDRIEILRGPQSTLYGSEAMGGVINIVTKNGGGPPTASASVEYGSFDSLLARGSFAAREGKFSFSGDESWQTTDNNRINSDYNALNLSGRVRYDFSDWLNATFLTTYLHSDDGSPGDIFTDDPTARLKNENLLLGLTLDADPTPWWNAKLILSRSHENGTFDQPANAENYYADIFSQTIARRNQVDFQNVFTPSEHHTILIGGTIEDASGNYSTEGTYGTGALSKTIDTYSAYAQYDFTPVQRVTLTAGGRVDDSTSFGTHETYQFGARFTAPCTETIFRANVASGFRAPSISDLYYPGYSNPNLKPEESVGWDVGFEQPLLKNKLHVGATFFYNDFDNLIQYSGVTFSPENIDRARTYGVETFASWQILANLSARASYTWLDARDLVSDTELVRRPENSGSVNVNWKICPKLEADVNALFVGQTADYNYDDFSLPLNVTVPGHTKLDLALRWHAQKHLEIFARAENLLGENYQEVFGYPALGRGFYGGLRAQF